MKRQRCSCNTVRRQPYLDDVLVDVLRVSVHQVDLLDVLVLDDDPLVQLALLLGHGCCGGTGRDGTAGRV